MTARLLAAGALLALLGYGLFELGSSRRTAGAVASVSRPATAPQEVAASLVAADEPDLAPAESLPVAPVAKRTEARPAPPAAEPRIDPSVLRRIEGRIVRVDEEGRRFEEESGMLRGRVAGRLRISRVERGAWSILGRPGEVLELSTVELEDRRVRLTSGLTSVRIPDAGPLLLEVEHLPGVPLDVLDDATGAHLPRFDLFEQDEVSRWTVVVPWHDDPTLEGLSSPFELNPVEPLGRSTERSYWIRAEGYAWQQVVVDFDEPEPVTVRLAPAGRVVVEGLDVLSPDRTWSVEVRRPRDSMAQIEYPLEPHQESLEVGPLELGEWVVALVCSASSGTVEPESGESILVDSRTVEVLPGRTSWVRFDRTQPVVEAGVPLAGVLVLAPGARVEDYWIEVRRAGKARAYPAVPDLSLRASQLAPLRGDSHSFHWDAGLQQPGQFQLLVGPTMDRQFLDLVPPGLADVELVATETAEVGIRMTDAATGAGLALESLRWLVHPFDDSRTSWMSDDSENGRDAMFPPDVGRLVRPVPAGRVGLRLPIGRVTLLMSTPDDLAFAIATIEVLSGGNEFTVTVDTEAKDGPLAEAEVVRHEEGG